MSKTQKEHNQYIRDWRKKHPNGVSRGMCLPKGESCFNSLCHSWKDQAKKRSLTWRLTKEQLRELSKGNCFYCGVEPKQVYHNANSNGDYTYNGIDRIDNTKGYTTKNSISCCKVCNRAKSTFSLEDFKLWSQRFAAKQWWRKSP